MEPFNRLSGLAVVLDRVNVDTDQIIPARYLKRIEKTGFGPFLFHAWRHLPDGSPDPAFPLNRPANEGAQVLVTGRNFGSGSSREHAVWALTDYGFRAVIAPSFAEIFHKNCFENGLVPVLLPQEQVDQLMAMIEELPGARLTVDLEACAIEGPGGKRFGFVVHQDRETHEFRRQCLLAGLDEIGLTLQHEEFISDYEERMGV